MLIELERAAVQRVQPPVERVQTIGVEEGVVVADGVHVDREAALLVHLGVLREAGGAQPGASLGRLCARASE